MAVCCAVSKNVNIKTPSRYSLHLGVSAREEGGGLGLNCWNEAAYGFKLLVTDGKELGAARGNS